MINLFIYLLITLLYTTVTVADQEFQGRGTLVQAQVIARHGARTPLTKSAASLLEGGAVLTPIGEKQLYDLGIWLRNRYKSKLNLETYESGKVHIQSSDFDRTVISASSMALGLFPKSARFHTNTTILLPSDVTPANIPVHTKERMNDVDIRGYTLCPLIREKLATLYDLPEFKQIQEKNNELLTYLGKNNAFKDYIKDGKVELKELWNVYDSINVAKTECDCSNCANSPICLALPDPSIKDYLTDAQWVQIIKVAHQVEHLKFGKETTSSLIGRNILNTILRRMDTSSPTFNANQLENFVFFSSHYPTLLGIFSSLNMIQLNPNTQISNGAIPDYGSAIVFELWMNNDGIYEVVALFKDGDTVTPIVLPCSSSGSSSTPCTYESFSNSINNIFVRDEINTNFKWCNKCKNNESDICMREQLIQIEIHGGWSDWSLILSMFIGVAISMACMVLCFICKPYSKENMNNQNNSRREIAMGTRHGNLRADELKGMERLEEEDDDDGLEGRI